MRGGLTMFGKVFWVLLLLQAEGCFSLNLEGWALLRFREGVEVDPHGVLRNWNAGDDNPCNWFGVHCIDGKVDALKLEGLSLGGTLAPELGKLSYIRYLILSMNKFSGAIPKEIARLTMLELLDLRGNNLSCSVPKEIRQMLSLKHLLLSDNKFKGRSLKKLNVHSEEKFTQNLSSDEDTEVVCINRKLGCCIWHTGLQNLKKAESFMFQIKAKLQFLGMLNLFKFKRNSSSVGYSVRNVVSKQGLAKSYAVESALVAKFFRRKLLQETTNLAAAPISGATATPLEVVTLPSMSSGSFAAVSNSYRGANKSQPLLPEITSIIQPTLMATHHLPVSEPTSTTESKPSFVHKMGKWIYIVIIPGIAILALIASMLVCRRQGVAAIVPWKTGLSGQLQKAFISGVPKLNRLELEAACEDFSNIVCTYPECTVFKGTLSSGVEIGVLSTVISSAKDWSRRAQMCFRKKIDMLSRVNHKNFVNLLGFCEETEPFMRMMVFEYVPNGTLYEHLHVKDFEHLDWNARMRIIMGTAYCLHYMHHEINPPVTFPDLQSTNVYMTDDYAAKIADASIFKEVAIKENSTVDDDMDPSEFSTVDTGSNIYGLGLLMLEIISGKPQYSEEEGSLLNWAKDYLNESRNIGNLVDPTLRSFKNEELEIVVEVIQECIHQDPKHRFTMKEVINKLREVIAISPEAATPRLSPLWWAELEILSVEAT